MVLFEEWYFGNKRSDFDPQHPHPTPFSLSLHCSCRKRETCDAGWLLVLERSRIRRGNALVRNVRVLQYFFLKKLAVFLLFSPRMMGSYVRLRCRHRTISGSGRVPCCTQVMRRGSRSVLERFRGVGHHCCVVRGLS